MGEVKKIYVQIFGELLTLVTDEEEEYRNGLAAYIDSKIDNVAHPSARSGMHPTTLSLLASVMITDELFKEREKNLSFNRNAESSQKENERLRTLVDELWQALEQTWNDLNAQKEQCERLRGESAGYKQAMEKAQKELEDYIDAFDGSKDKKRAAPPGMAGK